MGGEFNNVNTFESAVATVGSDSAFYQQTQDSASVTKVAVTHVNQQRRRVTGRVIGLSHVKEGILAWLESGRGRNESTDSIVAISFPSMPEVVDLARESEYRVAPIYMAPDGIHQYLNTKPLEIPVTFQLSIHDREYCNHGALTLLATAAKLHSLVLPINTDMKNRIVFSRQTGVIQSQSNTTGGSRTTTQPISGAVTTPGATVAKNQDAATQPSEPTVEKTSVNDDVSGPTGSTYPPVAVLLDLISDGREKNVSLGVSCIGYINRVRTRLKGPWLQPPNSGKNMPSMLECEFTFVHFPGYTNRFPQTSSSDQRLINAYAEEVRSNFYNLSEKSIATNLAADAGSGSGELGSNSSYQGLTW